MMNASDLLETRQTCEQHIAYFRAKHTDFALEDVSRLIQEFADLIPDGRYRKWIVDLSKDTLVHLLQLYLEKLNQMECVDAAEFSNTIKALGVFGGDLTQYCIDSDPEKVLWKLSHIAASVVPYSTAEMVTNLMIGFSQLFVFGERFLNEAVLFVEVNMESFDSQSLAEILYACTRLHHVDKFSRLMARISNVIIGSLHMVNNVMLIRLLWTISTFRWKHVDALQKALVEVG